LAGSRSYFVQVFGATLEQHKDDSELVSADFLDDFQNVRAIQNGFASFGKRLDQILTIIADVTSRPESGSSRIKIARDRAEEKR
jgi:hypothetical protein